MPLNRTSPETLTSLYRSAVAEKDVAAFLSLYAEDVVVFDAWGNWVYRGRDQWAAVIEQWFGSIGAETVDVTFDVLEALSSEGLAMLQAFITYTSRNSSGEKLRSMDNRLSWVLRMGSDGWQVSHEHTSAPADFQSGKALLHRVTPAGN